jgi:hypothetical protein
VSLMHTMDGKAWKGYCFKRSMGATGVVFGIGGCQKIVLCVRAPVQLYVGTTIR